MSTSNRARQPRPSSPRPSRPSRPSNQAAPVSTGLAGWRRRHPVLFTLLPVVLVLVAVATMVIIKTTGGSASALATGPSSTRSSRLSDSGGGASTTTGATALPAGVLADVTGVSASTLAKVGSPSALSLPIKITVTHALLTGSDGKPDITYVGAEYCPFCAAERWAMVEALSRFGTFSGLSATHSSDSDKYPDTKTFSFYGSTYSSPYLDFTPTEIATNQVVNGAYATLQTPTAAEQTLLSTFDVSQYTSEPGAIPFVDIGNRYLIIGASYTPQILQGLTMRQIAADLNDPSSVVATAIDGTANNITASICTLTGGQPASVCASPTIAAIMKKLEA